MARGVAETVGAWLSFRCEKVPGTAPIAFPQALHEGGRRRASSAVAALPVSTLVTALLVRRWAAADQKAGAERTGPSPFNLHVLHRDLTKPNQFGQLTI